MGPLRDSRYSRTEPVEHVQGETHGQLQETVTIISFNSSFRRETYLTVDRTHLRRAFTSSAPETFKIGDIVEILGFAGKSQNEEEFGWRRATIVNMRGKFVSLEFDAQRHPEKLA